MDFLTRNAAIGQKPCNVDFFTRNVTIGQKPCNVVFLYFNSYLCMDLRMVKDGAVPDMLSTDKAIVANFITGNFINLLFSMECLYYICRLKTYFFCPLFLLAVLFRDFQILIGGRAVNSCHMNFMYESYLRTITELSEEAISKWEICGLYKQTSQTQVDPTLEEDLGIKARYAKTKLSRVFRVYTPLNSGISSQSRILPNLLDLKFVYTKSDSVYHYNCAATVTANFHIEIKNAFIALKRVHLYPSIENSIVSRLNNGDPARFFFRHEYARSFSLAAGTSVRRLSNILLTDYLPRFCLITLLEERDYLGHKNATNFNFQTFNLESLYGKASGQDYPLDGHFMPEFGTTPETSEYGREYFSLIGAVPGLALRSDFNHYISQSMWPSGFAIYRMDFSRGSTAFLTNESYLDQRVPCSGLDLYFKFRTPLTTNVTALVFVSYIEALSITSNQANERGIELNYAL